MERIRHFDTYEEFMDYLVTEAETNQGWDLLSSHNPPEEVQKEGPLKCPDVAVLPEKISVSEGNKTYEKGSLICMETPGNVDEEDRIYKDHRCCLDPKTVRLNEEGKGEMKCKTHRVTFELSLKEYLI